MVVLAASIQDRDDAKSVLSDTYLGTPVRKVLADGASGVARHEVTTHSCHKPCHDSATSDEPDEKPHVSRWCPREGTNLRKIVLA